MLIKRSLVNGRPRLVIDDQGVERMLPSASLSDLLQLPYSDIQRLCQSAAAVVTPSTNLAPVDGRMEVWACGVTYLRSRDARMEESASATVYDRVYGADRPELFFKASAWRVTPPNSPVGIRVDSANDVPEPELAVVINARGEVIGGTLCLDMTSRDIEGQNPLYLPQAKLFAGSCALGPGIRPSWEIDLGGLEVSMTIERKGQIVFSGTTRTSLMKRHYSQLVEYLMRAEHFPHGAVLSTGTGIVPPLDLTLEDGDTIHAHLEGVGSLTADVRRGKDHFVPETSPGSAP